MSPTYRSVIILPCLILMLVTGCSFLLTPESGEKLILSGISLIGVLMFLIYFAISLPFHQHTTPILGKKNMYLMNIIITIFMVFICYVNCIFTNIFFSIVLQQHRRVDWYSHSFECCLHEHG